MKIQNLEIHNMTLEDLDSIKDSLNTDFDDFWNYNVFKSELENPNSKYLVAKINDKIVGFAGLIVLYDEADITNIVVHKDFRHSGIGSLLLNNIIELARSMNLRALNLEVKESNLYAIYLYKKYCFEQNGRRKKYYNNLEDAILMTLTLK